MQKKLHILFLCSWYPSKVLPTNGDFIKRHAQAVSLKHKVSVLHIISKPGVQKTEIEVEQQKGLYTYIAYIKPSKNTLQKIARFYTAYKQIIKKIGAYDMIHVHRLYPLGLIALCLKTFKRKKYIISEHWTGYHAFNHANIKKSEQFLSKKIVKRAHAVCPVSSDLKNSMTQLGLRGNYKIIGNVVNTEVFIPQKKTSNIFSITHISDLFDEHKNISGMLQAAKKLEDEIGAFEWKFIGGNGENYQQLLTELNFQKATIQFIDHVQHEKIADYLNNSNVSILFSNYENLPCVILESFSCGTPVISTDVGGIKEFFPTNFGFLIEKGDEASLVEKIIQVYQNSKYNKQEMHTYVVDNFSEEKICDSFTELYQKALA